MPESKQGPATPRDKQQRLKLWGSQMGIGFLHHISKFYIKNPIDKQSLGSDSLQDSVQWLRAKSTEHSKWGTPSTELSRGSPQHSLPMLQERTHSCCSAFAPPALPDTAQWQGCTLNACFSWYVILAPRQAVMPSLKLRKWFLLHFK